MSVPAPSVPAAIAGSVVTGLFNRNSAKRNIAFQREMSNTAWQRATADMKAAGINPILAAKVGPASTPGGAQATMPDLGATYNSAMQVQQTIKESNQNIENKKAELVSTTSENVLKQAIAEYLQTTEGKKLIPTLAAGGKSLNPVTALMRWFTGPAGTDLDQSIQEHNPVKVIQGVERVIKINQAPDFYPKDQ